MEHPDIKNTEMTATRMPVVFVGHGSPMNVVEDNRWSRGFAELGELMPRPKAILAVSAHWFVDGTFVLANPNPRTIYDFSGFPPALYAITYPAPGSVDLATRVRSLLGEERASLDTRWGFDHGTWSVLHHMFPQADIPVIQLSIDRRLSMRAHYELATTLSPLRDEGVLILGSGNVTHNLSDAMRRMYSRDLTTPDWATRFDDTVKRATAQHDTDALVRLWDGPDGRLAHPSPDHWIPMLYAYGATDEKDRVRCPVEGFDAGSLSMRNVVFG